MPAIILSGRIAREARIPALIERVRRLGYTPRLAIIQVGDRPDSTTYIKAKKSFAAKIGIEVIHEQFPETISQGGLVQTIDKFNTDSSVKGIIIQLPLPDHLDTIALIETVDPAKDVDGLTTANYQRMILGEPGAVISATARGVFELFAYYKIDLHGKKVVVVGRSRLVGTPIAVLAERAGAIVTICHSKTSDIAAETRLADIVIVAAGKPGLITASHVQRGAIIIDVGVTKIPDGSVSGDVDHEAVTPLASAITPVPGGVGPMTVLGLFENIVDACV